MKGMANCVFGYFHHILLKGTVARDFMGLFVLHVYRSEANNEPLYWFLHLVKAPLILYTHF